MINVGKAMATHAGIIARFQERMALETENIKLEPGTVVAGVNAIFDDPGKGTYYIAEIYGKPAGCLLTTWEWSDWRNGRILWIQSVYVLPEHRKGGIFKALYNYIKLLVEDDPDLKGIRLYVDKTNDTASKVYYNCGMDGDHYRLFEWIK